MYVDAASRADLVLREDLQKSGQIREIEVVRGEEEANSRPVLVLKRSLTDAADEVRRQLRVRARLLQRQSL